MPSPKYNPHYTVADYSGWEGDWELWRGVAVSMTPSPFGIHQKHLARLAHRFISALEKQGCVDCDLVVELDWVLGDDTVVRPDLSIVCGSDLQRFIDKAPTLVVEVLSESTKYKDQTAKYELYEQQGVKYYLMAHPQNNTYDAFELKSGKYRSMQISPTMTFELEKHCIIEVSLEAPSP